MSRLRRSIFDILFGNILLRILGVIFTPLLVRALSKAEYGEFIGLLAIFQVLGRFSTVGLFQATNKYAAEVETDERGGVLFGSLTLATLYSVITGATILIVVWQFGPIGFGETLFAYIAVLVVLFRNPFVVVRGFLYGLHQERFSQALNVIRKTLYTAGGVTAAYAGFGSVGIFISYVTAYVISVLIGAIAGFKHLQSKIPKVEVNKTLTRKIGTFGAVNIIGFMSALLLYKTDILLIRHFLDDTSVAAYQAALFPAELVWIVPGAIQGALLQNTAGDWAKGRIEEVTETLQDGLKYGVMALILFGIGLFALAEEFLVIYFGPSYVDSALLLRILLLGAAIYGINRVYIPVLQAIGELKRQQATNVIALVINIILNLILIPRFGTLGAAVATTLSYSSVILGSLIILNQSPLNPHSTQLVTRLSILFFSFLLLYALPVLVVPLSPLWSLLVFSLLGAVVFVLLSHILNLFTIGEVRQLVEARLE